MKSIAFIGTGLMGKPMAMNLLKKGFSLTVYNRSKDKTQELVGAGARLAASPREAAERADVVITMLANIEAVDAVLSGDNGILKSLKPGSIYIDMSTITPEASQRFAERVEATGAKMLDSPVIGTTSVAMKGELTIIVGGDPRVLDEIRDILQAMGKFVFHIGDHGSACGMKLVINHFIAGMIELLAEGFQLSEKLGIDPSIFSNVLNSSAVRSPTYDVRTPNMVSRNYPTQFPVRLLVKDLNYITQTAEKVGAVMPVHSLLRSLYSLIDTRGHSEQDFSVIYELFGKE